MINIPEITEGAYKIIMETCTNPNMNVFAQAKPNVTDTPEMLERITKDTADTQQLVELELIRDITHDHEERAKNMKLMTEHEWRIYQITPLAVAMFKAQVANKKPN